MKCFLLNWPKHTSENKYISNRCVLHTIVQRFLLIILNRLRFDFINTKTTILTRLSKIEQNLNHFSKIAYKTLHTGSSKNHSTWKTT